MICIGIDIGTQSLKAVLLQEGGHVLAEAAAAYSIHQPEPSWAEQEVGQWEAAAATVVPQVLQKAGLGKEKVECIAIAAQLDGCLAVDAEGQAQSPCLIWMDRRAADHMPALDAQAFQAQTGLVPDASHMAAKIRFLQSTGHGGARFHQPCSYLVERLCGAFVFDPGLASTTMVYDLAAGDYAEELLRCFGVERWQLPEIRPADAVAGHLSEEGAKLLGLLQGTPVAVGTGDDFATPLGAGLLDPGPLICILGTAEVCGTISSSALIDPRALVETHGYMGRFFLENPGWLSGGAVTWCRNLLGIKTDAEFDALASQAPVGCHGLSFLPALGGAMAPEWIPGARGCFYGLTAAHDQRHMARAVLEGCAFAMRDVRDRLVELGLLAEPIVLLGGGARSQLWAQIRADLCQTEVLQEETNNCCAIGAGLLALSAMQPSMPLATTAEQWPRKQRRVLPRAEAHIASERAYARYRALFEALRPMYL